MSEFTCDQHAFCINDNCAPRTYNPPAPVSSPGEVYKKYAAEIDKMYERRTRGDYSSLGILSEFARELKAAEGGN